MIFKDLVKAFEIDMIKLLDYVINEQYIKSRIIDLNQSQLEEGKDSLNNILKTYRSDSGQVYSNYTIKLKRLKGQVTNKVTLRDSGQFYQSFRVLTNNAYIQIVADFDKGNGNISDNLDTRNVLGLNDENLQDLTWNFIYPEMLKQVKKLIYENIQKFK